MAMETLNLHERFEAGGNDPDARTAVLDTVERLVQDGLLEERGNDFNALKAATKRDQITKVKLLHANSHACFDQERLAVRLLTHEF